MSIEEAEDKAHQAVAMGLIQYSQFDDYVEYLLKKYGNKSK